VVVLREVTVKTILNVHKHRDSWFLDKYSVNPYSGCPYNCLYCYTRGSKYSSRTGLAVKINAPQLLERSLQKIKRLGVEGYIALSTSTEAWNQFEKRYGITRKILEVIALHKMPVHVLTKSPLVLRDTDLLLQIDKNALLPDDLKKKPGRGVLITFSFSTLDENKAKLFEPGAPSPKERLKASKILLDEGFMVGLAYMPILPYITDDEIEEMMMTARDIGASYVFFALLTLYGKGKEDFLYLVKKRYRNLYARYRLMYRERSFPPRTYSNVFYRKVKNLAQKYGVKLGIKDHVI